MLDGANGTEVSAGVFEFNGLTAPFAGALLVKPAGAAGNGSPYPVDQVLIELYETASASGAFGNATFEPGVEVLPTMLVAWYTIPGLSAFSTAKIPYAALQGDEAVSVETTVNNSHLRVNFVSSVGLKRYVDEGGMLTVGRNSAMFRRVHRRGICRRAGSRLL